MDAALIAKCADPDLGPAIVKQFLAAAGSDDPLAITVKQAGRLVLVPHSRAPREAIDVVRSHVGRAVVRVGLTQFPVGIGVSDASRLQATMFDPCENLRTGTAMFAKVARIVTRWYGSPTDRDLLPQMLEDAIRAWKSGYFETTNIFRAEDPGGPTFIAARPDEPEQAGAPPSHAANEGGGTGEVKDPVKPDEGGIRIDLSRIDGRK
ncbi:TraH family protein [Neorhizobium alkalisoli]|uniref:TraH protein n=1 Tax=Neorhizobium alkalisoli TaxID=528178 RepID=A0A561PZB1_9HYPH|nr:TraH family protein [Neorhizobium alkalisoli]TWF43448.1 TraH protein [Neorhizobium alkalisoli]